MITTTTQDLVVELVENEILNVELVENEIFDIDLTQIDIIHNTRQFTQSLEEYLILNEIPTQLTARIFQTANNYISDSIVVYFNGIKEKYINKLSDNTFSFNLNIIAGDIIEIGYIKQP